MSDHNVRFPPDSTGKRVAHTAYIHVGYSGGTLVFEEGEEIVGATSGIIGSVIKVIGSVSTGILYLLLNPDSSATATVVGEALQGNSITHAIASDTGTPFYVPSIVQSGGNNPKLSQYVDKLGAAYVRFAEGSPQFDAFGKLQTSQQHKIADYNYQYDTLTTDFTTVISGAGVLSHIPNASGVLLSCGTAAGDLVRRTSDEYHTYQAGVSQLLEMTAAVGDMGKTNVDRRWGIYDDNNGLYFQVSGTTLSVGLRSKVTGTVVDEVIPQSAWNGDRVNGAGGVFNLSGVQLDLSKDNIYWIDFQWLGAGNVRFGVIVNGVRITCHELDNSNKRSQSYMTTGSLPLRYMQENTGISASTSEFRVFCAVVKTEGAFTPFRRAFTSDSFINLTAATATGLISIRPAQLLNGVDNRSTIYVNSLTVWNGSNKPILFNQYRGPVSVGGAWVAKGGESAAELNKTMTSFTGGSTRFGAIIAPNESKQIDLKTFESNRRGIRRKADITQLTELLYSVQLLGGGTAGDVFLSINWDEVR